MSKLIASMTLQEKLHALMLAATSGALLVILAAALIYEDTTFQPRVLQQEAASTKTFSLILQAPLDFDDKDTATRYLSTRSANPEVAIAALYDRNGQLFASYRRGDVLTNAVPALTLPDQALFLPNYLEYWTTLSNGGHLYLKRDLPPLYARMPQYTMTVGAVLVALTLVGLLLYWSTQKNVLKPLHVLLNTARQITENDDYRVRTALNRQDEFGALAKAFDRMLAVVGEREDRLRTILMNSSDLITVLAVDGRICFQSPSIHKILGYVQSEMIGRNLFDLVHLSDLTRARQAIRLAVENGQDTSLLIRLRHANGSWRDIEATGTTLDREIDGGRLILNARDVTDKLKLEEQFRQSQKLDAIGQLTGGVAHDFNNLLTIISGNAMLIGTDPQLPDDCRNSLLEIERAAKRAADLTRQLLTFSRRQSLQLKSVNLNAVITDIMRMLHRLLSETIEVRLKLIDTAAFINADASMMEQVLLNLALNARDAMPSGGQITISTSVVDVDATTAQQNPEAREGPYVCLRVIDTGTGIAADALPHIFEPFFTTKAVGKGTGLGLATVYGIVKQHQGWISCTSELCKGTEFSIYLPRQIEANTASIVREDASQDTKPDSQACHIMLVEDEPNVRALMRTVLTRQGHTLFEADSSTQALALWITHRDHIDLLITDLVIPGPLDGYALATHILNDRPTIPVIYVSGYSAHLAGENAHFKQGVNFLAKPFNPQHLQDLVQKMMHSPRQPPMKE